MPATSTVVAEHADMLQVGTRNVGELRPAPGRRRVRQAGDAQARHDGDHRGVADGGGVRRPARQPRHGAVRARHPDLRAQHPQHPRHLGRPGRAGASATCRSSSTPRTPAAAATSSYLSPAPRSRSAPTGSSSTSTPTPSTRSATVRRRCSAPTCARWPRLSASCPRSSAAADAWLALVVIDGSSSRVSVVQVRAAQGGVAKTDWASFKRCQRSDVRAWAAETPTNLRR